LNELSPAPGSKKARKRVGRGTGSGHGKTSGRGHKGAGARSGASMPAAYEGGQMPLQRRLPRLKGMARGRHTVARPTVYAAGGRRSATATGDFLFSRAFAELAATRSAAAVSALSAASSALARGELMQRADAWSADVTSERYLERCRLKTASLFSEACRLGAILGDPSEASWEALAGFGCRIGLAFQILDDVLDVSGPAERTGKHRGTDLLDGTVTLPLIVARGRDRELERMDLHAGVTEPAQADALCERIAATGALEEARTEALRHVAEAKAGLVDLELPDGRRDALDLVADSVVERYA